MKKLLIIIFLIVANMGYSQYYDDLYYDSSYDGYSGGNEHLTTDTIEEDGTTSITNNYYLADYNDYYYTRRIRLRYFSYWRPYYTYWCYPHWNYNTYYNYGWGYHSITYMNPYYSYYYPNYYNNYNYTTYYNKTYKNNNTYYGYRTRSSSNSDGHRTYTNTNKGKKVVASAKPRTITPQKATVKKTVINTRQTPKKNYTKTNYVSNGSTKTRSTHRPTANRTTTHYRSSATNKAHSPKKTTTNRVTYSQNRYKSTGRTNNRNTRTFSNPTSRGSLSPKVGIRGR